MIVAEVPEQTGFDTAAIVTLAVRIGLTVIVIRLDVAGLPVAHGVAFEVSIHLTTSLFDGTYE
jgi:hypothetical protein